MRFDQNSRLPMGFRPALPSNSSPSRTRVLSVSGIYLRGVHLGSFYNVNRSDPSGTVLVHNSNGDASCKNLYFDFGSMLNPGGPITTPKLYAVPVADDYSKRSSHQWSSSIPGPAI